MIELIGPLVERIARLLRAGFSRLGRAREPVVGIYGAPNAGKTLLANRICEDWRVEAQGSVSEIPHETRTLRAVKSVKLSTDGASMTIDIVDTPGLASRVTSLELEMGHGLEKGAAEGRAREAGAGILAAIAHLDKISALLLVVDTTEKPDHPVNLRLLKHARARRLPVVIVLNKIDLAESDVDGASRALRDWRLVPVSALMRWNMDTLYVAMLEEFPR